MDKIILLVVGLILGGFIIYFILRKKLKQTQELDENTIKQNLDLKLQKEDLTHQVKKLTDNQTELQNSIYILDNKRIEIENSFDILQKKAKDSADAYYEQSLAQANSKLELDKTFIQQEKSQWKSDAQAEYLKELQDLSSQYQKEFQENKKRMEVERLRLLDLSKVVDAAVEEQKRAAAQESQKDFYRLQLSDEDIEEVKKLQDIAKILRNPEPLNKVIWKVYYEKPYSDLIGRVIGTTIKTGIYKITNIENQMCYVGQAANVAERWRQHIKRALGAEAQTKNKLYPAMAKYGPENFTFELLEECDRSKLDMQEDFWQDFYHAKDYGYSIK